MGEHNLYVCGGSLIAPNVILTAAHCLDNVGKNQEDINKIVVRCGEWDTRDEVDPICLPQLNDQHFTEQNCVATGWGKDEFGDDGNYEVIMKQVQLDMVNHGQCENILKTTRLGEFFKLDQSFTCA